MNTCWFVVGYEEGNTERNGASQNESRQDGSTSDNTRNDSTRESSTSDANGNINSLSSSLTLVGIVDQMKRNNSVAFNSAALMSSTTRLSSAKVDFEERRAFSTAFVSNSICFKALRFSGSIGSFIVPSQGSSNTISKVAPDPAGNMETKKDAVAPSSNVELRHIHLNKNENNPTQTNVVKTSTYSPLNFIPLFLFFQFRRPANVYFLTICILQVRFVCIEVTSWDVFCCRFVLVSKKKMEKNGKKKTLLTY